MFTVAVVTATDVAVAAALLRRIRGPTRLHHHQVLALAVMVANVSVAVQTCSEARHFSGTARTPGRVNPHLLNMEKGSNIVNIFINKNPINSFAIIYGYETMID